MAILRPLCYHVRSFIFKQESKFSSVIVVFIGMLLLNYIMSTHFPSFLSFFRIIFLTILAIAICRTRVNLVPRTFEMICFCLYLFVLFYFIFLCFSAFKAAAAFVLSYLLILTLFFCVFQHSKQLLLLSLVIC